MSITLHNDTPHQHVVSGSMQEPCNTKQLAYEKVFLIHSAQESGLIAVRTIVFFPSCFFFPITFCVPRF
jgi:hypothetical protein